MTTGVQGDADRPLLRSGECRSGALRQQQ